MKVMPFVSAGEPVITQDGAALEIMPMQLIRMKSGMTVLRIGRNTFWFNEDGSYDGCEACLPPGVSKELTDEYVEALKTTRANRDRAPASAYFQSGSEGHTAEIRGWPESERPKVERGGN